MSLPDDFDLVDPHLRAGILIDRITIESRAHERQRARSFTAREGLLCLAFEALLVATSASNNANDVKLTDDDRARNWLAYSRIMAIVDEAVR